MTGPAFEPLRVPCPRCGAKTGAECVSVVFTERFAIRVPHADRVTAARRAG